MGGSRRGAIAIRLAAIAIVLFSFGSYGLARHGAEPFPTGRLPGFDDAPVEDGVTTAREYKLLASFGDADQVAEIGFDEVFPDVEVSIQQIVANRMRPKLEAPSGGLARIVWDTVGAGSPLRRNQPLDYRTAADTQSVLVDAVTEATGASPSRLEVITDETLTDTDSGDVIERNVTTLVVICEVCS